MIPVKASLQLVSGASIDVSGRRDCLSGHKGKFESRPLKSQMGHSRRFRDVNCESALSPRTDIVR
jgi:hypothetical protein